MVYLGFAARNLDIGRIAWAGASEPTARGSRGRRTTPGVSTSSSAEERASAKAASGPV